MFKKIVLSILSLSMMWGACSPGPAPEHPNLSDTSRRNLDLVPLPTSIVMHKEKIDVSKGVYIVPALQSSEVIVKSLDRFVDKMKMLGVSTSNPSGLQVFIEVDNTSLIPLNIDVDESYSLKILPDGVNISASNYTGLNHGLETLGQLLLQSKQTGVIAKTEVYDQPRYLWRGIMIDVSRHWISKEMILKNLDGMASAKMNVLHLHLSDDQGFRVASKIFPKLHLQGSGGDYFSHQDIKDIVTYARDRGIRIIPEFDVPGHTTSWLAGYPEIGSRDQHYEVETGYGVFPNILNPASEHTYAFIKTLFAEMAGIFPDQYLHVGGDEILYEHWNNNPEVQKFMSEKDLVDPRQLQAYFHLRVERIIKDLGKKMVAWDEALRPELDKNTTIIQSWHGHSTLFRSAKLGFNALLSSGWYLDHKLPMSELYLVDPAINPDHLEILPDTANWQIWKLNVQINNLPSEGSLVLFGSSNNLTGVINMMNRSTVLENGTLNDGKLEFDFKGGFGTASIRATMQDDKMEGTLRLAVMGVPLTGEKIGGSHFIDGVPLPNFDSNITLSEEEQENILGGEACLWTEWVNAQNVLSRIWPRTAAIAEKLWSPVDHTTDVADIYRRTHVFSNYLLRTGVDFAAHQESFIDQVSDEVFGHDLRSFLEVLEEVKHYDRWSFDLDHNINKDLNNLADAVFPESTTAFNFGQLVDRLQAEGPSKELNDQINLQLEAWIPLYRNIRPVFKNDKLKPFEVLALSLSDLSKIAAHVMESKILANEESDYYDRLKRNAQRRIEGVFLSPATHLIELIDRFRTEL